MAGSQLQDCRLVPGSLWGDLLTSSPVRIEAVDSTRVRYRYLVSGAQLVRAHTEFLQLFRPVRPLGQLLRQS